ncbi:hypothetical protein W59_19348 [Rhodococcus opacus RKJ300 = JCM 13270]|uniref:Uncharacterized protein n=3 Tax=Nocardiaceae TaxID=85025 RepID=A0A2S8J198_RHOOP|nr:hypothetical protein W59_19348 [Rhodococcus opacus RKJ300 = JCM 13270]PQP20841.1 hypothetical protein C5613_27085 [Rhodococcus opacus]
MQRTDRLAHCGSGVVRFRPPFRGYPIIMNDRNTEPSESEKPYDPATDPDADPENLTSTTHQPNQAEGADEEEDQNQR